MIQRLPDFFVLGAQKAGTTTLHDRLVSHPDVCLPKLKETQFFSFDEKFSLGLDWYRKQFSACHESQLIGEVCPDYMYFPGTAERIHSCIECPKMIFIFRHPLQRAYSHYLMSVRQGFEKLSFVEALLAESERIAQNKKSVIYHGYMSRGGYAKQVKRFQSVFPASDYLFVRFDDLIDNGSVGEETFADICDFLDIVRMNIDAGVHSNAASQPRSKLLRDTLYGHSSVKKALGLLLPQYIKETVAVTLDRWNQRELKNKDMGEVPSSFVQQAELEIEELQSLTGLNLKRGGEWM
ncbi:MAG: sulfotransferase [Mariprofundaceae bacterium]